MSDSLDELYESARFRDVYLDEGDAPEFFAVITACDPNGDELTDEENLARTETFREFLEERDFDYFPATGYGPETDHSEPGFGVICDLKTALELGRKWEQLAIFWVEAGMLSLIWCEDEERLALGSWWDRVD